jgi:endonuclease G, mitochondrial
LCWCQQVDTIVSTPIYKSYFSYSTHTPLFVAYKLYKGGGTHSRTGMRFKSDPKLQTATYSDYDKSGYDIGHMANAEDFAYDCEKEQLTFRYINAIPQNPHLNRGIWKHIESTTRRLSQTDSLLIICGGYDFERKIGNVWVPSFCFKIVKDFNNKTVRSWLFSNNDFSHIFEIDPAALIEKIPFGTDIKPLL